MGNPRGFLQLARAKAQRKPVGDRVTNWGEFYHPLPANDVEQQGARCMDCGVPFCQGDTGCPVQNLIPEWNDLVYKGRWRDALDVLHETNNFPEFTGRLCPAPCETACVLGLIEEPVAIRAIEQSIIDHAFAQGWVIPLSPTHETGNRVAVVGSGPAGLAAAQQLRRMGHSVVVYEKDDRIGGLLRYGIPDFKMEKSVLDRRIQQMMDEGVVFKTNTCVGRDLSADELLAEFDATCLTIGAALPRDLSVPGRELNGIHPALDFLSQQNREIAGDKIPPETRITAHNKRVIIIGGGDTGSDCLGTCHRQGAREVHQFELLPEPPTERSPATPWPLWPMQLRSSHAHEEGGAREWGISTTMFVGQNGYVKGLRAKRISVDNIENELEFEADLVLLAMGYIGVDPCGLVTDLGVELNHRGVIATNNNHMTYMTNVPGVFAAGDARRGASLIVWAIREGRDMAVAVNQYLALSTARGQAESMAGIA